MSNYRFAEEFKALGAAIHGAYRDTAARIRIERNMGMAGLVADDVPLDWSRGERQHLVWRATMFAKVPEDQFEHWIKESSRHTAAFSVNSVRAKAMRFVREELKHQRLREASPAKGITVYEGDITQLSNLRSTVPPAAIITDPPYEGIGLPLWGELGRFAKDILPPGGWLVAMSGQRYLPAVIEHLNKHLHYCWTMGVYLPGNNGQGWIGRANPLNTFWKPILIYSKDEPLQWPAIGDYIVSPGPGGEFHKWGQNVENFQKLLAAFSQPGELVVDPFLGGGTTAIAAIRTGRSFEGFDVDPGYVRISENRIAEDVIRKGK